MMSQKENILYIDDEHDNLEIFSEALSHSFNVITTSDPKNIYSLLNDNIIKAALIDIHMPLVDGFEVLKKIKAHPSGSKISLFIFSSDETQSIKMKALSQGIDDFLFKSMEIEEIIQRIGNSLSRTERANNIIRIGNLEANFNSFQIFIEEVEISLTLTEYKLIMCLANAKEHSVSMEDLKRFIFFQQVVSDNNFRVQLTNLRSKLSSWNYKIQSKGRLINLIEE
jgi:DNA-binding response OmpR family regulator